MVQRQPNRSEQEWMALINECRTSGLTDKDWCEQNAIPVSSFYSKISNLRKNACEIPSVQTHTIHKQQVVPLEVLDEPTFSDDIQINRRESGSGSAVILNIHGYRIEIANHATKETILNTLSALQQLC